MVSSLFKLALLPGMLERLLLPCFEAWVLKPGQGSPPCLPCWVSRKPLPQSPRGPGPPFSPHHLYAVTPGSGQVQPGQELVLLPSVPPAYF